MSKKMYVFEIKYKQFWKGQDETTEGCTRVSIEVDDAQCAVDMVQADALKQKSDYMLDGEDWAKCIGFGLSSVNPVTDYEELDA